MRVIAAEDIEKGDPVFVTCNKGEYWYAYRAFATRTNAIAKCHIGQDDVCHWDPKEGSLTKEDCYD